MINLEILEHINNCKLLKTAIFFIVTMLWSLLYKTSNKVNVLIRHLFDNPETHDSDTYLKIHPKSIHWNQKWDQKNNVSYDVLPPLVTALSTWRLREYTGDKLRDRNMEWVSFVMVLIT